jgi:HSP20 family protein
MRAMIPWAGTNRRQDVDRLLERFFEPEWPVLPTFGDWAPSLDLSETKENVVVKMEVPGMDPCDLHVSLQDNVLTVRGEKRQEKEDKDEHYHRVERNYGTFMRTVKLPVAVDGSRVAAAFKNGLLTVTLPKAAAAKTTTVPVNAE